MRTFNATTTRQTRMICVSSAATILKNNYTAAANLFIQRLLHNNVAMFNMNYSRKGYTNILAKTSTNFRGNQYQSPFCCGSALHELTKPPTKFITRDCGYRSELANGRSIERKFGLTEIIMIVCIAIAWIFILYFVEFYKYDLRNEASAVAKIDKEYKESLEKRRKYLEMQK